ncbi:uncharacterized protein LOC124814464 [Hydra vulgaris]|uniref:uncharacterized protein LOC124814464 n=1 Tax=Hydra vulgaris TaxID=6087 RepID=UPI001F5EA2BF|nr:uncharacterized protein LOC124814464 [Hydra vulgaris]
MTCISCKVMESIIDNSLKRYLQLNNFISIYQFGFLKRRSTCTQMLASFNEWTSAVNKKKEVDIIYIDFKKAFDSVSHSKLVCKMNCYGIKYELLNWITNFLTDQSECVCIGDCRIKLFADDSKLYQTRDENNNPELKISLKKFSDWTAYWQQ